VIVGPSCSVLIDAAPGSPFALELAAVVLGGGTLEAVLHDARDAADVPAFGAAEVLDGTWTLWLRGLVSANVTTLDGLRSAHRTGGHARWNRIPIHDPLTIDIALPGDHRREGTVLDLGLTVAGAVSVRTSTDRATADDPLVPGNDADAPTQGPTDPGPAIIERSPAPTQDGPALDLDFHHLFEETTFRPSQADASPSVASEASTPPPAAPEQLGPGDDDHVTRVFEPDEGAAPAAAIGVHQAAAPPPPAEPAPSATGLIDWVPGAHRPAASPPPPAPQPAATPGTHAHLPPPPAAPTPPPVAAPPPSDRPTPTPTNAGGDDDALEQATITVAALRAAREATSGAAAVAALHCPAGHPNPTHADACRSCGQTIVDRTPRTISRPPLGRLRLPDGARVALDRHLLLGRKPADDVLIHNEPTGTVPLADPERVLSRTHAAIVLDGWQVQVVDRDSMNHTFVQLPGREPFQLRPGEPCPIPPGTAIRLGDEVEVVFEVEAP
jgi:hypothetical protein